SLSAPGRAQFLPGGDRDLPAADADHGLHAGRGLAASRSSPEFAVWLREHRRFGPPIVAWENERAIPRHAKLLACLLLSISIAVIAFGDLAGWGKGLLLAGLAGIALWIMTRPEPSVRR